MRRVLWSSYTTRPICLLVVYIDTFNNFDLTSHIYLFFIFLRIPILDILFENKEKVVYVSLTSSVVADVLQKSFLDLIMFWLFNA